MAEANEAGGRDNITVVAFRVEEGDESEVADDATLIGPSAEEAGLDAERVRAAAERRAHGPSPAPPAPAPEDRCNVLVAALLVIAGIVVAAVYGARQVYFLGIDEGGRITLYRGLPYELPLDLNLYNEVYSVPVRPRRCPRTAVSVTDHELRSRDDALSLIEDLEAARRRCRAPTVPTADPAKQPGGSGGGQRGPAARAAATK